MRSGLLDNTGEFRFVSQVVASSYRPLHIYSTLPHARIQSMHEYGRFYSSNLQRTPGSVEIGSRSHHKQTALEFV